MPGSSCCPLVPQLPPSRSTRDLITCAQQVGPSALAARLILQVAGEGRGVGEQHKIRPTGCTAQPMPMPYQLWQALASKDIQWGHGKAAQGLGWARCLISLPPRTPGSLCHCPGTPLHDLRGTTGFSCGQGPITCHCAILLHWRPLDPLIVLPASPTGTPNASNVKPAMSTRPCPSCQPHPPTSLTRPSEGNHNANTALNEIKFYTPILQNSPKNILSIMSY